MSAVIAVEGLRKEFRRLRGGRTVALDGLDLEVPTGGVFGFLGPNGSGKTTTIRILLGLVRPTGGSAALLGRPVPAALPATIRRVGSLVESPTFFPGFSGRRNLTLLGAIDGIGAARVDAVLERVGLAERAGDLFKSYSLGMKQRLGVAAALLKEPELLILDEPANGLDPAGIRAMRELIRSLGRDGHTVFVSSHLLSEVQQTCDRVAILQRGRCVRSGRVDEVLADATGGHRLLVRLDDLVAGRAVLERAGFTVTGDDDGALRVSTGPADAARLNRTLGAAGLWVSELRPDTSTLEDAFLALTSDAGVAPDVGGEPSWSEHAEGGAW